MIILNWIVPHARFFSCTIAIVNQQSNILHHCNCELTIPYLAPSKISFPRFWLQCKDCQYFCKYHTCIILICHLLIHNIMSYPFPCDYQGFVNCWLFYYMQCNYCERHINLPCVLLSFSCFCSLKVHKLLNAMQLLFIT